MATDGTTSANDNSSVIAIALGALSLQTRFEHDMPLKFDGVEDIPLYNDAMILKLKDFTSVELARTGHEAVMAHLADQTIPVPVRMEALKAAMVPLKDGGQYDVEIKKWKDNRAWCNEWHDRFLDLAKEMSKAGSFCCDEMASCMAAKNRHKMMVHSMGEMVKYDKVSTNIISDFESKYAEQEESHAKEKEMMEAAFKEQLEALKVENARLQTRDDKAGGKMDYLRRMLDQKPHAK